MFDRLQDNEQMLVNEQYLTIKKIGVGGFGIVWRAYDFSLRNFVAIKELRKEYIEPKFIEMFYKEALIAKNIIHDNIVRVQHFWKGSNGLYYISMDYVTGYDLEYLIKKCNKLKIKIPWELAILICASVLKAIDHANRIAKDTITGRPYGIVYRDISPGNIIISFDGSVKLSDFGIAKTADELNDGTKQRIVTGKYAYMSPEQIKGDPDIDHRSDIFSIGVVLYEMLTGEQLYKGDVKDIKDQVLQQRFDPRLLDSLNIPFDLATVVVKALEKNKGNRYEKAIEMFRDLRRLLRGKETEDIAADLADFVAHVLTSELENENELTEWVKQLTLPDVKNNPNVQKVRCRDFIVGEEYSEEEPYVPEVKTPTVRTVLPPEPSPDATQQLPVPPVPATPAPEAAPAAPTAASVPPAAEAEIPPLPAADTPEIVIPGAPAEQPAPAPVPAPAQQPAPQYEEAPHPRIEKRPRVEEPRPAYQEERPAAPAAEEKGKTVFEEVGDWLVTKFKIYRMWMIRIMVALFISALLFVVADTFLKITPLGKMIYSRLYPPDVIVTTVPSGATVTLKTREGKVIIANADTSEPLELRKIQPRTYILSAVKEGFKPVERVVKIEEKADSKKIQQQRVEINFDFVLGINSTPPGAEVYVDGNRFGVTPCKAELIAGEHTVKLTMKGGFEDLGSVAKEAKPGQCNIDLTKPTQSEMFRGVDTNYWAYQLQNTNGEAVFNLTGQMYKNVSFNTAPANMVVQVKGESKPRGNTPIKFALKSGDYELMFLDPDGRFKETDRTFKVAPESETSMTVYMDKWVTFRVRSKEHPDEAFSTTVKISGNGLNLSKEVSTGKPLRIAMPVGVYKVVFEGDNEYEDLVLKGLNIADKYMVVGEMVYAKKRMKYIVKEEGTNKPVYDAYVWLNNQLIGKTDGKGICEKEINHGKTTVKIVAKGFIEKTIERNVSPGRTGEETILIAPEPAVAASSDTIAAPSLPSKPVVPAEDRNAIIKMLQNNDKNDKKEEAKNVIVCPNCKKEYPANKKLRFCTNCGRPFR